MLSQPEFENIMNWHPYREDWLIGRNQSNDNIELCYGSMIAEITNNPHFATYRSQNGGLSNYLEFICYRKGQNAYNGLGIMLCISLCAPVAAYGETSFTIYAAGLGYGGLFAPETAGIITDASLLPIESEILRILNKHSIGTIDNTTASQVVPGLEAENDHNLNFGNQYLHGLFQWMD